MTSDPAIEIIDLTKRYGSRTVLDNICFNVPRGSVFAFLGTNGAGKTTTIHILLNIISRTSGQARVLGLDCARRSLEIKRRVGFVAEGQSMYDWMSVDEIIRFCRRFYPSWDDSFVSELKTRYELSGESKIGELSRGTRGKLALLLAMAYRPELLILDEPTSGLDVLVRHDFLRGVIELIQNEGHTVFFSTHQVSEVEKIADWVGIINQGKLMWCSPMEALKASIKKVVLSFDSLKPIPTDIPNLLRIERIGRQCSLIIKGITEESMSAIHRLHPASVAVEDISLERIFMEMAG
ncbi:MAG: ABC transporter ATP-binding protein [Armatimonadota bacterium]